MSKHDLYLDPDRLAKAAALKAAQDEHVVALAIDGTKQLFPSAPNTQVSDGSTASYYELPPGATELQDLISFRDMNAQLGEIFRACYRYGQVSHSSCLRDAKKIQFYINAEIERLERWGQE